MARYVTQNPTHHYSHSKCFLSWTQGLNFRLETIPTGFNTPLPCQDSLHYCPSTCVERKDLKVGQRQRDTHTYTYDPGTGPMDPHQLWGPHSPAPLCPGVWSWAQGLSWWLMGTECHLGWNSAGDGWRWCLHSNVNVLNAAELHT